MGLLLLRRPPRPASPVSTAGGVPEVPGGFDPLSEPSMLQSVLPIIGGVGFVLFMLIRPSPVYIAIGVVWLLAMVGGGIGMAVYQRRTRARRLERTRRVYLGELDAARVATREELNTRVAWQSRANPAPASLPAIARAAERLWERRRGDADALQVRIGTGILHTASTTGSAGDDPLDADVVCIQARDTLREAMRIVRGVPAVLPLSRLGRVRFETEPDAAGADVGLARAMVAQLVTWHAPSDLRLVVCCPPEREGDWAWIRWLPHVRWTEEHPAMGAPVLTGADAADIALDALVRERRSRPDAGAHVVVVVDGAALDDDGGPVSQVAGARGREAALGITVLDLSSSRPVDAVVDAVASVGQDGTVRVAGVDLGLTDVIADRVDTGEGEILARLLSPWRLPGHSLAGAAAADRADLPTLLGVQDVEQVTARTGWRRRPFSERLAVPIGISADGDPVVLDLKESAASGMGPHGLVVGATGSGKSELLRTVVLSLAATHPPEDLAFVLVDFKGGAAFAGLTALPHVAGTVTNLAGDGALVERMRQALRGEVARRQQLLADAGRLDDIGDYERLREQRADPRVSKWMRAARTHSAPSDLPPLPRLLIVIDEFAELLEEHSDVANELAAIGRVGRSLGIHLLLASQRFEGAGARGLESHLSYRIALRTFTEADSTAVLGSRIAATLPAPGGAILRHAGQDVRFQVLHVGGSVPRRAGAVDAEPVQRMRASADPVVDALLDGDSLEALFADPSSRPAPLPDRADEPTLLDVVVRALRDDDRRTAPVWLPPLPDRIPLSSVLPPLRTGAAGVAAAAIGLPAGRVPIAFVDRPLRQRVDPFAVDLFGEHRSLLVLGAAQSGKSQLLATLVLSAALTHTPDRLHIYAVDLGGGSLSALAGLPHLGSVATRSDPEAARRTLGMVVRLMDERDDAAREHGWASAAEARAAGVPDVLLVIDGVADLRKLSDEIDDELLDIGRRGPGVGVHLVVAASRGGDIRPALRDVLAATVELRLGDPSESVVERTLSKTIPLDRPGRGLVAPGLVVQCALPAVLRIDDAPAPSSLRELVAVIRSAWRGDTPPAVPVLPARLDAGALEPRHPVRDGLVLGVEESRLDQVRIDLTTSTPHLLVLGDGECGKSSLLRHVLRQLGEHSTAEEAVVYVADPALSLLDAVAPDRLAGYAASFTAAQELAEQIAAIVRAREPGADVPLRDLRRRSWWSGPEIYLVVDDYDQLLGPRRILDASDHPLGALLGLADRGAELGLHLVLSARLRGSMKVFNDGLFGGAQQRGCPAFMMSGDRSEGVVLDSHRPRRLPPGRGLLVRQREEATLVQTPWVPPSASDDVDDPAAIGALDRVLADRVMTDHRLEEATS